MRTMNSKTRRARVVSIALAGAAAIGLASCGGGNDNNDNGNNNPPPPASNTPPASASADVAGFIAFLKTLVVQFPETTEPLDLTNFTAPTSDTTEPDPSV